MYRSPKASKILRWGCFLGTVTLCLILGPKSLRAQFLKSLFHRDKPATVTVPKQAPPAEADGGYRTKQRYDSLTGGTQFDLAKLISHVHPFVEKQFPPVIGTAPKVPGAEMVGDDTLCATCHLSFVKEHRTDIHRNQSCEVCHGPASEHLKTRGTKRGLLIAFKTAVPADGNEVCLSCHEQHVTPRFTVEKWRVSTHAHASTACTACHKNHYTVPPGTPATQVGTDTPTLPPRGKETAAEASAIRAKYEGLGRPTSEACAHCHQDGPGAPKDAAKINNMLTPGTPHQIGGLHQFKCTTCHDPHGVLRNEVRTDMCVQCHQQPSTSPWHTSSHAKAGMACVDCHNPHSSQPKLGALQTSTCYKCHAEKADQEQIAHPHQINGARGFQCVTCHNPHDNIRKATREDVCLTCHKGHPNMAWKSSTHALYNVTCVDCHNPHPVSRVQAVVYIDHNQVDRPKRMPMSVEEPRVCYRCHQQIAGLFQLPFHHPVPEGKMLCSRCHDVHGEEGAKLLREPTVNLTCFKCHSSKQGPFVYDHPPVVENCMICHNAHGTVNKQLLRQPATFLCLRCHSGHNGSHHVKLQALPSHQPAFYKDCSQCHHEVHGSDLPSVERKGPRLQR